jgi:hypothetical protein
VEQWLSGLRSPRSRKPPQSEYHYLGMTGRIAGPLEVSDELSQGEVGEEFEPLLSALSDDQADEE